MKQPSNRGAARVGAVWMIVAIVLFFVALAYAYVANQAATQAREDRDAAIGAAAKANEDRTAALTETQALTAPVGFANGRGTFSDPAKVAAAVESLVSAFGLPDSLTTVEQVVSPVITTFNAEQQKVASLDGRISTLLNQSTANQNAAQQVAAALQAQITTITREKADAVQALQDRVDTLEADLASMTADRNAKDDAHTTSESDKASLELTLAQEKAQATSIQANIQGQLKEVQKRAETPDGEILSVSKALGIAWIDRGTRHRISEGMVFDVVTGHPNPLAPVKKALCEVIRVTEKTAEVRIFDQADPYDPVVEGDVIYNPIYDPEGELFAVLAGRFGGIYNEAELTLMLEEIGISVQKKLDLTTNYLVVGQPMYVDEDGEPLEEPMQPSDLEVYKNAQAQGCTIISINDFRQYFRR